MAGFPAWQGWTQPATALTLRAVLMTASALTAAAGMRQPVIGDPAKDARGRGAPQAADSLPRTHRDAGRSSRVLRDAVAGRAVLVRHVRQGQRELGRSVPQGRRRRREEETRPAGEAAGHRRQRVLPGGGIRGGERRRGHGERGRDAPGAQRPVRGSHAVAGQLARQVGADQASPDRGTRRPAGSHGATDPHLARQKRPAQGGAAEDSRRVRQGREDAAGQGVRSAGRSARRGQSRGRRGWIGGGRHAGGDSVAGEVRGDGRPGRGADVRVPAGARRRGEPEGELAAREGGVGARGGGGG